MYGLTSSTGVPSSKSIPDKCRTGPKNRIKRLIKAKNNFFILLVMGREMEGVYLLFSQLLQYSIRSGWACEESL